MCLLYTIVSLINLGKIINKDYKVVLKLVSVVLILVAHGSFIFNLLNMFTK